jgi:hypothetical protein
LEGGWFDGYIAPFAVRLQRMGTRAVWAGLERRLALSRE